MKKTEYFPKKCSCGKLIKKSEAISIGVNNSGEWFNCPACETTFIEPDELRKEVIRYIKTTWNDPDLYISQLSKNDLIRISETHGFICWQAINALHDLLRDIKSSFKKIFIR